jgi:hypothetical protein
MGRSVAVGFGPFRFDARESWPVRFCLNPIRSGGFFIGFDKSDERSRNPASTLDAARGTDASLPIPS